MKTLQTAIKNALENYETPDSPEGLSEAMRVLRMEYEFEEIRIDRVRKKQSQAGKETKRRLTKKEARRIAKVRWAAGAGECPSPHDGRTRQGDNTQLGN